jgi:hypothetical protein
MSQNLRDLNHITSITAHRFPVYLQTLKLIVVVAWQPLCIRTVTQVLMIDQMAGKYNASQYIELYSNMHYLSILHSRKQGAKNVRHEVTTLVTISEHKNLLKCGTMILADVYQHSRYIIRWTLQLPLNYWYTSLLISYPRRLKFVSCPHGQLVIRMPLFHP